LSAQFVRFLILGMPANLVYEIHKKHLQCIGITVPIMGMAVFMVSLNAIVGYFLVFHTRLSFLGSPISTSISQWVGLIMICSYFKWHRAANAAIARIQGALYCGRRDAARAERGTDIEMQTLVSKPSEIDVTAVLESNTATNERSSPAAEVVLSDEPAQSSGAGAVPAASMSAATTNVPEATKAAEPELSFDERIDLTWQPWSWKAAFTGWREFLQLGAPSAAMLL
jgi:hypothetical protein